MKQLFLLIVAAVLLTTDILSAADRGKPMDACKGKGNTTYTHHVPHETDCHKFYKCLGGMGHELSCPESDKGELVFNPKEQICDWIENVPEGTCTSSGGSSPSPSPTPSPTPSQSPSTPSPTPSQSPSTLSPTPSQSPSTPSPTPSQSPSTLSPTPSQSPSTPSPTPSQSPSTPSPTPSQSPSTPSPTPSQTPSTPSPTPSQSPSTPSPTPSQSPSTPSQSPSSPTPIPAPENGCPITGKRRLPHETDCHHYYICQNGLKERCRCYGDHVFNKLIRYCDRPENVKCFTTRPVQPTDYTPRYDFCPPQSYLLQ